MKTEALALPLLELAFMDGLEGLRLLTLSQAAELLHVSTRTIQRMIRRHELPAFKVGGQWRLRESQLVNWLEDRENAPQNSAKHPRIAENR
jgi:excisionase family DNA binding protein